MTTEQLKEMILSRPGLRNRNIDVARQLLYGKDPPDKPQKKTRIKQSRSGMNKLESDWLWVLQRDYPEEQFRFGQRRYMLANGVWYKPDFTCQKHKWPEDNPVCGYQWKETAWEVKGPKAWRGGFEFLKIAAHCWPEVRWVLVWREDGHWNEQEVLP